MEYGKRKKIIRFTAFVDGEMNGRRDVYAIAYYDKYPTDDELEKLWNTSVVQFRPILIKVEKQVRFD
jgi:hypothetical protein